MKNLLDIRVVTREEASEEGACFLCEKRLRYEDATWVPVVVGPKVASMLLPAHEVCVEEAEEERS